MPLQYLRLCSLRGGDAAMISAFSESALSLTGITHCLELSLAISHVFVSYGQTPVLTDISIQFSHDQVTAVLGKSGSGKSTLLQVLNGTIKPQQGEVTVFGQAFDYRNAYRIRRKMGYVIQQAALFPHLTIGENILLPGKAAGVRPSALGERVRLLMQKVDLPFSFLNKFPHELSGGEQQRAGLCRALVLNPPIVLMDEPFASLDQETRHYIYRYLTDIQQQEPRTTVLVTHSKAEAMRLADHFVFLAGGEVQSRGKIGELGDIGLTDPGHEKQ